jgi:hypothetical protein
MHTDQQPYRQLYDDILGYEGEALYEDLVRPWLAGRDGERRWLEGIRARRGAPVPPMATEERWRLYALSRIIQLLQLSFGPRTPEYARDVAPVGAGDYAHFMDALGLEPAESAGFHPFYHEIVTVDAAADEHALPQVVQVYWPGCRLGPLLISRAGCRVRAGRRHLVKEIAERSTLYWATSRNTRPTDDPSHGWGGNSQWRTPFRRDYLLNGALYYNVDAKPDPGAADPELDDTDRAELLRHRCFVTSSKPSIDRWPYGFTLIESA